MTKPSVEELMAAETWLNRSFGAAVFSLLANLAWMVTLAKVEGEPRGVVALIMPALLVLELGCYVWFAVCAGRAAKILGGTGWTYVAWIIAAPLLSLLPIPIVSLIIRASPLSIKFLLGNQLERAIRESVLAD
jgi:hypothetical protein